MAPRQHLETALRLACLAAASLLPAAPAAAQASRAWVDPPGEVGAPAPPESPPRPADPAPPTVRLSPPDAASRVATREDVARNLAVAYLDAWSSPNEEAIAATADFYAPVVTFHGRVLDLRALLAEKRRFARRWPARRYVPRPETLGVGCRDAAETCTVRSVFDFEAAHPRAGRRARGVATLELVVSFDGRDAPAIVAENSILHGRGDAAVPDNDKDLP
jgi:hypothetical protein